MTQMYGPIKSDSLVEVFIKRFEELILSGQLKAGQKLPSDRELAEMMEISRPVVHKGLISLENMGLINLTPRKGAYVNDYRKDGSISILKSLLNYNNGKLEPEIFESLLQMRKLFEMETARLATIECSPEQWTELDTIVQKEENTDRSDIQALTELDFSFHHQLAMASGNTVYPLLLNSFKQVYTSLTSIFFSDSSLVAPTHEYHRHLVQAIEDRDEDKAREIMAELLEHGEKHLRNLAVDNN